MNSSLTEMPSSVNAASLGGGGGASNNDNANNNGNGGSDDGVRNEEEVCSSYAQRLLANFNQLRQQNSGLCDVELVPGFISASTATAAAAAAAASSTATEPASSPEDSSSSPGFSSLLRPPPTPTNRTFLAHRTVLAAASPYFNAMFTSDLAEARRARVVLRSVGDRALSELLDFVYTGRVRVTRENVQVRDRPILPREPKVSRELIFTALFFFLPRSY